MIGDANDMSRRLNAILPSGWFSGTTPVLSAVLQGLGTAFAELWILLQSVIQQTRVATATDAFLDYIAADFFGVTLFRYSGEQDSSFRLRISDELLRARATRPALIALLQQLTGRTPKVFEPTCTNDTGGYGIGGVGYGVGGGWGNLALPFQFFVTAFRPGGGGIPEFAGYSAGGIPVYGSLTMEAQQIPDVAIQAAVTSTLPAGTIGWMRISD